MSSCGRVEMAVRETKTRRHWCVVLPHVTPCYTLDSSSSSLAFRASRLSDSRNACLKDDAATCTPSNGATMVTNHLAKYSNPTCGVRCVASAEAHNSERH